MTQEEKIVYLNDFVTIVCPIHGDFMVRASDHLGQNPEGIAYGCPKCEHYTNPDNKLEEPIRRADDTTYEET